MPELSLISLSEAACIASNTLAFAVPAPMPAGEGHTLIVPRRALRSCLELSPEELSAMWALLAQVKALLDDTVHPSSYSVGFELPGAMGEQAACLHVLPCMVRREGNGSAPGPLRWPPDQSSPSLSLGAPKDPLLSHLRPLFVQALDIAIVAAFVQPGGLRLLRSTIEDALERGARIRVLTSDYLHITPAKALIELLDLQSQPKFGDPPGSLMCRVVEVQRQGLVSFHPKAWRFESPELAAAFVGSSNWSEPALLTGVEWNLRLDGTVDPGGWEQLTQAFEQAWGASTPLTQEWVQAYRLREASFRPDPSRFPEDLPDEPMDPPPRPNEVQTQALQALETTRSQGWSKALVVMATGLGKTLLAAFDAHRVGGRVLFVAHRAEILSQAAAAFRSLFANAAFGWWTGDRDEPQGDVVFASVQKLSQAEVLPRLCACEFDYVIVDEVHHASAPSYRRVLEQLHPKFLLGITATPERADEADILPLFDDNLVFRLDLGEAIERGLLSPFQYWGLRDTVDYAHIPWRSGRFDPEQLALAVETQARMESMWQAWWEHPAQRTIVFCCSIGHACFVRDWLRARSVRVEALHSGPGAPERATTLEQLREGHLDAICAVDLLNEGVDVPNVDRVVMLRPTESTLLFLQQLGRGLRLSPGKLALQVVDFVGNHRIFLERLRTLLGVLSPRTSLGVFLAENAALELPLGCGVTLSLEAKDLLRSLMPSASGNALVRQFRELYRARDRRPRAGELCRMGLSLRSLRQPWFEFCQDERALTADELRTLRLSGHSLADLEIAAFPELALLLLFVLLQAPEPLHRTALLEAAELALQGVPDLRPPSLSGPMDTEQRAEVWWREALAPWLSRRWCVYEGERLRLRLPEGSAFLAMATELLDYRLFQLRSRRGVQPAPSSFECRVTWNQQNPILRLSEEAPRGDLDVRLPSGAHWQFRMMKEFCNFASPVGTASNALPQLLRGWFGYDAGRPGTSYRVRFSSSPEGWWAEPLRAQLFHQPARSAVPTYPDLRAAAGAQSGAQVDLRADRVWLPGDHPPGAFAVRASGDSMDGGPRPIRDGDWVLMRPARGLGLGAAEGQVALVGVGVAEEGLGFFLKRVRGQHLCSDNPAGPNFPITPDTALVALRISTVAPEALAPPLGTVFQEPELAAAFGVSASPEGRVDGHLFLRTKHLDAPDRLAQGVPRRGPGETGYVLLALPSGAWRYCGVGRWSHGAWTFPAVDLATWQAIGGEGVSRTLEPEWIEAARSLVTRIPVGAVELEGYSVEVLEPNRSGGLKLKVANAIRNVSCQDLGWALRAQASSGAGLLDEAMVNRMRYLEGTKKGSTRYIDTLWAIRVVKRWGLPKVPAR